MRLYALLLLFCLTLLAPSVGQAQDTNGSSEQLTTIRADITAERFRDAWTKLVALHASAPETDLRAEANLAVRGLYAEITREAQTGNPDRALELAGFLELGQSVALIEATIPNGLESMRSSLRDIRGGSHLRIGQRNNLRGQRDAAWDSFVRALDYLSAPSAGWARTRFEMAGILRDRGIEHIRRGNIAEGERDLSEARDIYEEVGRAIDDAGVRREAASNIETIISQSPAMSAARASAAATTTTEEAPPEPGFLDKIFGAGSHAATMDYLRSLRDNPEILDWVLIIGGFIVIYWVIPGLILKWLCKRGDILASQARTKLKFLGIFALLGYVISRFRNRTQVAEEKKKNGCPHCGFGLDDPYAYEDLVFTKCPKCREQITPLFTLEGYISNLASSLATELEATQSLAPLEKIVRRDSMTRMVRAVITLAVRRRASDIHVEPDEDALVVRQRIDGMITEMIRLPRSLSMAFVSAIKVTANLDITERRKPQDGKLSIRIDKTDIDIRVASSPSGAGEKASLRLLDVRSIQMEAKHLGMSPGGLEIFNRVIHQPHGLVLVGGPTGSGKTTTLYIALQSLKTSNKNIISIEDPIEFRIPGVNQIQVNPVADLTFASGLRSILRQDPDVIMVGEIRDKETAEISVSAASTGHLVFSTIHTIDAASSVARLMDLGVTARQFADALALVMSQRLIRLVCKHCAEDVQPDYDALVELGLNKGNIQGTFRKGRGCVVCNQTGYFRRMGIFEFLLPSERLRGAIENQKLSTSEIRDMAIQAGMRTLRQEAIDLYVQGLTTAEETLRVTK